MTTKSSGKLITITTSNFKNKTIDKKQYVDIYKELLKKHIQLTKKYLPRYQRTKCFFYGWWWKRQDSIIKRF